MKNERTEVQGNVHVEHGKSLVDLPVEMLVKILSYLPTSDKIKSQYICRKLKDISEIPLLWRDFYWPDNEPLQAGSVSVSNFLRAHGEHVRCMFFPSHVTPVNILLMMKACGKMTRLCLPYKTQLSLSHLEKIVRLMTNLQELDIFISELVEPELDDDTIIKFDRDIKRLLNVTCNMKKVMFRFNDSFLGAHLVNFIGERVTQHKNLPQVINLIFNKMSSILLEFWPTSGIELPVVEIGLYDAKKIPLNIYPSVPVRKFRFGPAASPLFVKLSDHRVLGLQYDTFYLNDYGEVRHTMTPYYSSFYGVKEIPLSHVNNLHSVSDIDFSDVDIYPGHLEQLAIACPNLQRLNLLENVKSLQCLEGLRAIVHTCRYLQGLNLAGISVASVESYLLLWELLSSVKKLTHLAIDLCMLIPDESQRNDKQRVIGLLSSCKSLLALEISSCQHAGCENVEDLWFSHFPSLVYVSLTKTQCTAALNYTIVNCSQLKYLCYADCFEDNMVLLPLSSSCHLQQLCLESCSTDISASCADVLSAHGDLKRVVLFVNSITTSAIKTLINNSPNLVLLHIETTELDGALHGQVYFMSGGVINLDFLGDYRKVYKDKISKSFPYHKLFAIGEFTVSQPGTYHNEILHRLNINTEFNSFWTSAARV